MKKNIFGSLFEKICIAFCFILVSKTAFAQAQKVEAPYLQSPNAASLGIYGKIDVSPFTGLPNIDISVFSLLHKDIKISADLRYFGGGVKPEDHPGWLGQNWTLNIGGIVTRKRNGGVDEVYVDNFADPNGFAYYYNYGALNSSNWNSQSFMTNYLGNDVNERRFTQLSPDEFMFTLPNGKSGSFFKNDEGNWAVKSNNGGRILVSVSTNASPLTLFNGSGSLNYQNINRIINSIVITDDEGYVFTFGENLDAIEFIREQSAGGEPRNNVIANAWHLIKIKSPKGNIVNFSYQRGNNQFIQNVGYGHTLSYQINGNSCSGYVINSLQYSGYVITPSYLKEISCDAFRVILEKEVSNELKFPYSKPTSNGSQHAFNNFSYTDFDNGNYADVQTNGEHLLAGNPHVDYKLKRIIIKDMNGQQKEKYVFGYNNDLQPQPNQRLFLKSFTKTSPVTLITDDPIGADLSYRFKYDEENQLPPYNSLMVDEWGYYNGKPYPITNLNVNVNELKSKYMPDFDYAKKGSLSEIIYPTGGSSKFSYELNQYGQFIKKAPNSISLIASEGYGGGLRIKKIENHSQAGPQTSKSYFYQDSVGKSTGIMAGQKQIYFKAQIGMPGSTIGYAEYLSNNSISDLNYTNGRDVVYSEVKEVLEDGSRNIYKYSNSDKQEYRDEMPGYIYAQGIALNSTLDYGSFSFAFDPSYSFPLVSHTSRELERGQLLSKETIAANGKTVYKQVNQYRSDATRFSEYVKSFNYAGQTINCQLGFIYERYIEPLKIYTYFPYQSAQAEYFYDLNGNQTSSRIKQYTYNPVFKILKEEQHINSKNEIVKREYKYPFDFTSSSLYQGMLAQNLTSKIVQNSLTVNDVLINTEKVNYDLQNMNMYLPVSTELQIAGGDPQVNYYEYNSFGDMISEAKALAPRTSYLWSYKNQYVVAQGKNASPDELYNENFENTTGSGVVEGLAHTGKKFYSGSSYSLNWPKPNSKNYLYSYWYRENGQWKYRSHQLYSGAATLSGGDAYDDIQIHPDGAMVDTYTYEPLAGMSSETDSKGMSAYYQYDDFNRLSHIRNNQKDIVKSFDYNFRPNLTLYYNNAISQGFSKNDCPGGQTGTGVSYTVLAGKYSSPISQVAADQLALDEGQNYANRNGTCSPAPQLIFDYMLPTNKTVSLTFYSQTNNQSYNYLLSGDGIINNLPEGLYFLSVNVLNSLSNYDFFLDNQMVGGSATAQFPETLMSGYISLLVLEPAR